MRLMRLCDVGSLAAVTALALAVWNGHAPMALVLLVATSGAVLNSVYAPAAFGLMRAVVPPDQMSTATARLQARTSTARLVGPLVGGALFGVHQALPFTAQFLGLFLSTVCVALVRTRSAARTRAGSVFSRRELTAGLSFLWQLPYLRTVLLVFGLGMNFSFGALTFSALAVFSDSGRSGLGGGFVITCVSAGALMRRADRTAVRGGAPRPDAHRQHLLELRGDGRGAGLAQQPAGGRTALRALHVPLDGRQHRLPLDPAGRHSRGPDRAGAERRRLPLLDRPAVRPAHAAASCSPRWTAAPPSA